MLVPTNDIIGISLGVADYSIPTVSDNPRSWLDTLGMVHGSNLPVDSSSSSCGAMKYLNFMGMPPARGSTRPNGVW